MACQAFISPEARILWTRNLWKASSYKNDPTNPSKYRCSIVFSLNDSAVPAIIADYNSAVLDVLDIKPQQAGAIATLGRSQTPCLEYGAILHPGDEFYRDKLVLNLSRREEDGAPDVLLDATTPLMDKGQLYDGALVRAHCRFYGYKGGAGGTNCEMYGIMKVGDADRLGQAAPDNAAAFAGVAGVGPTGGAALPQGTPAPAGFAVPGQPAIPGQQFNQFGQPAIPGQQFNQFGQPIADADVLHF